MKKIITRGGEGGFVSKHSRLSNIDWMYCNRPHEWLGLCFVIKLNK